MEATRERITYVAKASKSLSFIERQNADELAETGKLALRQQTGQLIARNGQDPALQACSSDGTPISVSHSIVRSLRDPSHVSFTK